MYKLLEFDIKGDKTGSLVSLEQNKNIPFDIKRVYYIFNTKEQVRRGFHAHKNLQQVIIATSGSCKIAIDNGEKKEVMSLSTPNIGLLLQDVVWREMYDFSNDCVLMVLADNHYDEDDYIRNYKLFKNLVDTIR
mgnify:CR=1 FL=1